MRRSIGALQVPPRVIGLMSDCEGAYGIEISFSTWVQSLIRSKDFRLRDDETGAPIRDEYYRPLALRPDVIKASGIFPNKARHTLLHPVGNTC
jgi:hypothetical protein